MKKICVLFLIIAAVVTMVACSQKSEEPIETLVPEQKDIHNTIETPEPKSFAPEEIFSSSFNPFYSIEFPNNFNVYSASFDIGDQKFNGQPRYVLSMTAKGDTDTSITFLMKLAGIENTEIVDQYIDEFQKGGFCEFQSVSGDVFTIRETNPNDDRYQYVEGLHADILVNLTSEEGSQYISLVRDNFNINALDVAADYFDVAPIFEESSIAVNMHKKEAKTILRYAVTDASIIQQEMENNVKSNWYDAQNGKMGLSYGMIDIEFLFDNQNNQIYVSETTSNMQTAMSIYTEPEVSFSKLGFQYFEKDALCIYEEHEPHYFSIAVYRPEWGVRNDDWNIEYIEQVNGYGLRITYNTEDNKFKVMLDKNGEQVMFEYLPSTKEYIGEYPDRDTVKQFLGDAFDTQDDSFLEKPIAFFEQTLKDRFGISINELYELPIM